MARSDQDLEQALVGAVLLDNETLDAPSVAALRPRDFYGVLARSAWAGARALAATGRPVDYLTLSDAMTAHCQAPLEDIRAWLIQAVERTPVSANATEWARLARAHSCLRAVGDSLSTALAAVRGQAPDPAEILAQVRADADAILGGEVEAQSSRSVVRGLGEYMATSDVVCEWPQEGLQELTGGVHAGELVVVGARPSIGKTSFALTLVEHAAVRAGVRSLFVSEEMAVEELALLLACRLADVDSSGLRRHSLSDYDTERLLAATERLESAPIRWVSQARTIEAVTAVAARMARRGCKLMVLDYLTLLDLSGTRDRTKSEVVGDAAKRLKRLAQEHQMSVVVLCQLNRGGVAGPGQRGPHTPRLRDLRDSGEIEQHADVVVLLNRKPTED